MADGKLKLYYSPGSCSLAPHIALEETGADYEPVIGEPEGPKQAFAVDPDLILREVDGILEQA